MSAITVIVDGVLTCDEKSSRVSAAVSVDRTAARYGRSTFDCDGRLPQNHFSYHTDDAVPFRMFQSGGFNVVWKESPRCNTKIEQGNAALQVASHVQGPQIKRDPENL